MLCALPIQDPCKINLVMNFSNLFYLLHGISNRKNCKISAARTWCKWQLTGFYFNFLCLGGAKVKNTVTIYKIFPFPIDQINSFSILVVCISLRNYLHKLLKPKTLKIPFFFKKNCQQRRSWQIWLKVRKSRNDFTK